MNQTEQMRELCPSCRNADIYACTCPFKTARNSQTECFEPAKLVRLTEDEIALEYSKADAYLMMTDHYEFGLVANAIMDAMEAKNAPPKA